MNFNIYTKAEKEKLLKLKDDLEKAAFKMYGESRPGRPPFDESELIKENPLYLEGKAERRKALQEREKIRSKAYNRFKDKIIKHEEQYLKTAENKVDSYSDLIGAIFLKQYDDNHKGGNPAFIKAMQRYKFASLKRDIEIYMSDIYTRVYSSDSADLEPAKEILDKVDHIIDYRSVRVFAHYNDLIKENRLEQYLRSFDQIEGQQSFLDLPDKKEDLAEYQEAHAAAIELFEVIDTISPQSHIMPNNTLMNALQEGIKHSDSRPATPIINAGEFDLVVSNGKGRRKELTNFTMVSYDPEETGIELPIGKLTEYERQVTNAVISLWEEAVTTGKNPAFTLDMIYRAMPGGGDKASPQQKGAMTKAIEKLRGLKIKIDVTSELQARKIIQPGEKVIYDDYFFSMAGMERTYKTKNGKKVTNKGYKLHTEPLILSYAKQTKQLLTVNAKCIEIQKIGKTGEPTGEPIAMNAERQAITGYLLRQIAWIKYDHNTNKKNKRSDIIKFDTIFNDVGINTESRTTANRNRDFIFSVLDYETAIGYIAGYEKQTEGKKLTGVKILLKKR